MKTKTMHPSGARLESLDILRGFDLMLLVTFEGFIYHLMTYLPADTTETLKWWFDHIPWEGYCPWDQVMPLFMFMSGVTIPFALSRYRKEKNAKGAYRRIFRRVALLWIFGMMVQGNLLALDVNHIYLYSNTLQAIAMGYLVSSLLFLHTSIKSQIVTVVSLLLCYWGAMAWIGGGDYTPEGNLCEVIDCAVLGRFRHYAEVVDGSVVFNPRYHYTWLLSSLGFVATVMSGVFAGYILRNKSLTMAKRAQQLLVIGIALVVAGNVLGYWHPIIKHIWTSSMVLLSSGISFILMSIFFYVCDCCKMSRYLGWLKIWGMNSIVAYMLASCVNFSSVSSSLFHGLEQFMPEVYPLFITASNALIVVAILYALYRLKIFLRV